MRTNWKSILEKSVKIEKLGCLVADMTDEQLENYMRECIVFEILSGRAPDYFEERDIIRRVKK